MEIRTLNVKDAKDYLALMQTLDSETSFMLYEENERTASVTDMGKRIEGALLNGDCLLGAYVDGYMVAFIHAERGFAKRIRHSAYIVVGVLKGYSGKGIGKVLFDAVEAWAIKAGVTRLELTVMIHNERAVKLYKAMGFFVEGIKKQSLIVNGAYVDEYYMGKLIKG